MIRSILFSILILLAPLGAAAQEFKVDFGVATTGEAAPIEVTADSLSVDQATGAALFDGNVIISQGPMRMEAGAVSVTYLETANGISSLVGTGGVRIVSGPDVATADTAEYDVDNGTIQMRGNVSLLQGPAQITAQSMDVNLANSTAELHGRVRTVLQTGNN